MNLKQVTNVYFSPTGNTKTVVELIARRISDKRMRGNGRITILRKTRR